MRRTNTYKLLAVGLGAVLIFSGCSLFGGGTPAEKPADVLRSMQSKIQDREMKSGNVMGTLAFDVSGADTKGTFTVKVDTDFDVAKKGDEKVRLSLDLSGNGSSSTAGVSGEGSLKADLMVFPAMLYAKLNELKVMSKEQPELQQQVDAMAKLYAGQWWKLDLPQSPFDMKSNSSSPLTADQESKMKDLVKNSDLFTVVKDYGTETMNSVQTYHYGVELNQEGIVKFAKDASVIMEKTFTADDEQQLRDGLKKASLTGEVWVGAQDKFVYKVKATVNAANADSGMMTKVSGEMTVNPNKAVTVTAPTDAKDIKEAAAMMMGQPQPTMMDDGGATNENFDGGKLTPDSPLEPGVNY